MNMSHWFSNRTSFFQVNGYVLNIYILQNYLLLTYDHSTIYKWISKNFPTDQKMTTSKGLDNIKTVQESISVSKRISVFEKLMENICISGWIDFQHILATIRLHDQNSSIGFNRFRIILEQDQNKRGKLYLKCG